MNHRHQNRRIAGWLALLALLLLNVVPTLSPWRSTNGVAGDLGAWCGSHAAQGAPAHATRPSPHRAGLDHCGYCGLIRHAPPLPGAGLRLVLMPLLPQQTPELAGGLSRALHSPFAALPRGPPARKLPLPYPS